MNLFSHGRERRVAYVNRGYTGEVAAAEAKKGFVLLSRRWVVERSFSWTNRSPPGWWIST